MTNLISMSKRYKTRGGRDVRVLCTDNLQGGVWTVVSLIDGLTSVHTSTGRYYDFEEECELDLIEQPQEHSVWIEVFKSHGDILSCSYESENSMRNSIKNSLESNTKEGYQLIATKKVVVAEGEFCS